MEQNAALEAAGFASAEPQKWKQLTTWQIGAAQRRAPHDFLKYIYDFKAETISVTRATIPNISEAGVCGSFGKRVRSTSKTRHTFKKTAWAMRVSLVKNEKTDVTSR
jgi:hypothetical protein